jgi:hypothetical protein
MRTSKTRVLPARLAAARRRFERWRRTRKIGARIPESLWTQAVKLAEAYGVSATSQALAVDYYSLKKRLGEPQSSRSATPVSGAAFVELPSPMRSVIPECIVELENAEGAKMRIQLGGIEASHLAALGRSLWRAE